MDTGMGRAVAVALCIEEIRILRFLRLSVPLSLALGISLALFMASCNGSSPDPDESSAASYRTRGVVRQLAKGPAQELFIHHEAIPTFVNMDGEVQGMGSMAMPFPVSETALPDDLQVGDKVSFEFEVNWTGSPPMRLLALEKLAPDTLLSFEMPESRDPAADPLPDSSSDGHLGDHEHGGLGHGGGDTGQDDTGPSDPPSD